MQTNMFIDAEVLMLASVIIRGVGIAAGILLVAAFIQLIRISQKGDN
jgi:hypothetical protein